MNWLLSGEYCTHKHNRVSIFLVDLSITSKNLDFRMGNNFKNIFKICYHQ
jgi:hypothetical protein